MINKEEKEKVQFVPRFEDGMYFWEIYLPDKPGEGTVEVSWGEARRSAAELAKKYNREIEIWEGWH